MLGVSEVSKAYKLYNWISKKIIISRDVVFDEDKCWDWDKQYAASISCELEWGDKEDAVENEEHEDEVEATTPDATQQVHHDLDTNASEYNISSSSDSLTAEDNPALQ